MFIDDDYQESRVEIRTVFRRYTKSIDKVYLDCPTDPVFCQNKKGIFTDINYCLHFVIYKIRTTKFETNLFDDIIFKKLTL